MPNVSITVYLNDEDYVSMSLKRKNLILNVESTLKNN